MIKRIYLLFVLLIIFLSSACAPRWQVIERHESSLKKLNLYFTVPKGWYTFSKVGKNYCTLCLNNEDTILITKDFMQLNFIVLGRFDLEENIQPLNKKINPHDTIFEIAEDVGNNFKQMDFFKNKFKVIKISPHRFLGKEGFALLAQFNNPDGLPYKILIVGTVIDHYLYTAKLSAPVYYYFDDIKDDFENFISQIKYIE